MIQGKRLGSLLMALLLLCTLLLPAGAAEELYSVTWLDAPTDATLPVPCADTQAAISHLSTNASVNATNGIKSLSIAWSLPEGASYNAAEGAVNTFCWTAEKNKGYDFSAVTASGTIEVTNHSHQWAESGTDHPRSALSCTEAASYWKSCSCGAVSDTEYYTDGQAPGHVWSEWEWENIRDDIRICDVCGEKEEQRHSILEVLNRLVRALVNGIANLLKPRK